jgi:hypothetical protein
MDMPIDYRGKAVKTQPDTTSHEYTTDDLSRMFQVANTREKALLSLGASLGWELGAILQLNREFIKSIIAKANEQKAEYYYFKTTRQKTGAARLGVLNPLALEWVNKYLAESEDKKLRQRKHKDRTGDLFDLTLFTVNKNLRKLAKAARIVTTGRVHWHKIRAWVMSSLSRAGLNEFQIKYVIGKKTPISDSTYLNMLKIEVEERYPEAFELYLNIGCPVSGKTVKKLIQEKERNNKDITEVKEQLSTLTEKVQNLLQNEERLQHLKQIQENNTTKIPQIEKTYPLLAQAGKQYIGHLNNKTGVLSMDIEIEKQKLKKNPKM